MDSSPPPPPAWTYVRLLYNHPELANDAVSLGDRLSTPDPSVPPLVTVIIVMPSSTT